MSMNVYLHSPPIHPFPSPISEPWTLSTVVSDVSSEEEKIDLTEDFIDDCNKHFGRAGDKEKLLRLVSKMRNTEDLSEARIGLAMLAGIRDHEVKIRALGGLLELLESAEMTERHAIGLYELLVVLLKCVKKSQIQLQIVSVQQKLTEVFWMALDLSLNQFGAGNLNGLTIKSRRDLVNASSEMRMLNRIENARLKYLSSMTCAASLRIRDDRNELRMVLQFISRAVAVLATSVMQFDAMILSQGLTAAVDQTDIGGHGNWYESLRELRRMGKEAVDRCDTLTLIQLILHKKARKFEWIFCYGVVDILAHIALHGSTHAIQTQAIEGVLSQKDNICRKVGGLEQLSTYRSLKRYFDKIRFMHLQRHWVDPNIFIRERAVEHLLNIADRTSEHAIKNSVQRILRGCKCTETDEKIIALFRTHPEQPNNSPASVVREDSFIIDDSRPVAFDHLQEIVNPPSQPSLNFFQMNRAKALKKLGIGTLFLQSAQHTAQVHPLSN